MEFSPFLGSFFTRSCSSFLLWGQNQIWPFFVIYFLFHLVLQVFFFFRSISKCFCDVSSMKLEWFLYVTLMVSWIQIVYPQDSSILQFLYYETLSMFYSVNTSMILLFLKLVWIHKKLVWKDTGMCRKGGSVVRYWILAICTESFFPIFFISCMISRSSVNLEWNFCKSWCWESSKLTD
jgi:hypothetical protein